MKTIILTQTEVRSLLPMGRCIDLMEAALTSIADGSAINPLRRAMSLRRQGAALVAMPGYVPDPEALGLKVISLFPSNQGTDYDAHQGLVILFDTENGAPQAILEGSEVTAIRTAAASGLATRVLAREDAGDLAIIGSGVQARTHLEAMRLVRSIRRVRVFSPTVAHCQAFAATESRRQGIDVEPTASAEQAIEGADLICTTTASTQPVLCHDWVRDGAHINAVGSCTPNAREIDQDTMRQASLFVDCRESLFGEAGDFIIAKRDGMVDEEHVLGELGEVLMGNVAGRRGPDDVTLFKSLGVAAEDLAAAQYIVAEARRRDIGTRVALSGLRHLPT